MIFKRFFRVFMAILPRVLLMLTQKVRNVGGQAVIEGVMMRGPSKWSVAVRDTKGKIHLKSSGIKRLPGILRMPLIRGTVALYQALSLGIKAIDFSASKVFDEEDGGPISPLAIVTTIGFSFLLGIALFILLPLYATRLFGTMTPVISDNTFIFNLVDGTMRVAVFLVYVFAIGRWKEMRRIYEYHGAEHKVIHAYEKEEALAPELIHQRYSPRHPRCGTSFLLIVMMVSIMVFSVVPREWSFYLKFISRIVMIPLIAGISYEILKLSAKKSSAGLMSLVTVPGLFLQRLTTREPDTSQIEVALSALNEVVEETDD